ncbi:MAG: methyltransferase [Endomicrobium sp.]|nr:methyltransferase [Endomicrobium sp.]
MLKYASTFVTGLDSIVVRQMKEVLPKINILEVYDGLVLYEYNGNILDLKKLFFVNNTYKVHRGFNGDTSFNSMVKQITKGKSKKYNYNTLNRQNFRVRFSKENEFCKVDNQTVHCIENHILKNSSLRINRLNPDTEFWFIKRTDVQMYCQLITKRIFNEKTLNKGELRPEFAYLFANCINTNKNSVIWEPFSGYGAIPVQIAKHFRFSKLYVSDISKKSIENLKKNKFLKNKKIEIFCCDINKQTFIKEKSINYIITDPPWGIFENIDNIKEFYSIMLDSFQNVLIQDGKALILTAKKIEFEETVNNSDFIIVKKYNTLVNGKKASIYEIALKN